MYGFVPITAAQTLPVGAAAAVTGASLKFSVEEENMLVELQFVGCVSSTAGGDLTFKFQVDGADIVNPATGSAMLPWIQTWAAGEKIYVAYKVKQTFSKGAHTVKLFAGAATDGTILGTTTDCRLVADRFTADATMGQGVNSKVQFQE